MKLTVSAIALALVVGPALAGGKEDAPGLGTNTNLGQLTKSAIDNGFDQGEHSSSFAGSPRAGLANAVEDHNLGATIDFVEDNL